MVNFLPLASPKIPTNKNLFPTPSTKVIPMSPPYLPISFVLFRLCLSCYILLSTLLNENVYVINCFGKSWLYSSHKLDAHFIFIELNKPEPLWLKLWSYELDNSFDWECYHIASFEHCTYLYLVHVMYFCFWMRTMMKWIWKLSEFIE